MVEYKEFRVGELFDVKSTKKTIHKNMIDPSDWGGQHPYITRTTQNNGLSGYIDYDEDFLNNANTISLGLDTYTLSYQAVPYFTGNKVKVLHLKGYILNSRVAMYLISVYNRMFEGYDWGTGINQQAIVDMALTLPVTSTGQPNFDFMENYIEEIEQKHIKKLESDLDSRTENLLTMIDREDLIGDPNGLAAVIAAGFNDSGVDYAEFRVGDLFNVQRGRRLKGADREPGDVVYCSATQSNNGVTDHIDNPLFIAKDKITVSTFLDVFYQEGEFTASDEITMLGADWLDRSSGLFIATTIKKSQHGYGYSHKAFSKEVSNFIIDLPVTSTGQPDFDFMAQYVAYIELKYTHTDAIDESERIDLMVELTQRKTP